MKLIRIGSRGSKLALKQAEIVSSLITINDANVTTEIIKIKTTGDSLYDANLALIGGKGLFLKEIEEQLFDDKIDIAVHSLKDVPAYLPHGLEISCYLERENPFDAFLSAKYESVEQLPVGATIGTSSSRRHIQLINMRSDLKVIQFRGNIDTRIKKLAEGQVDACVLAVAGLKRIDLDKHIKFIFSPDQMLPAVGQGVICVEHKESNIVVKNMLSSINHFTTMQCVLAERAFMQALSGSCTTPMGAYAKIENENIDLRTMYYSHERNKMIFANALSNIQSPQIAANICANIIKSQL